MDISIEKGYGQDYISERQDLVEQIRQGLDPNQPSYDFFMAPALGAWEQGVRRFEGGDYRGALASFEAAKDHHGKPSSVLESWIGLSYQSLEHNDLAIQHFTKAIEIKDEAADRVNRGLSYLFVSQFSLAIQDAKIALSMPPHVEEGYHTEVEANSLLASSYQEQGDYQLAYVHAEAALISAMANDYQIEDVSVLVEHRDLVKSLAEKQN